MEKSAGEFSRLMNAISKNGNNGREYLLDEDGNLLLFGTRKDAQRHLLDRNLTLADYADFDYRIEEAIDE